MERRLILPLLWIAASVSACAHTVTVRVPPKNDLSKHGAVGLFDFTSNADAAVNERATREFQALIQSSQEGVRFVALGKKEAPLDPEAFRRIGERYGVSELFEGHLDFSEPHSGLEVKDYAKGEGSVGSYIQADAFVKLVETKSGASVWSRSSRVNKQVSGLNVEGRRVEMRKDENPRSALVPDLVQAVTEDFRPTFVTQKAR